MRSIVPIRRHSACSPRGYSLLELVAALALVAGTLVPALELMRHGLQQSIETDRRLQMASYAVSQMEKQLAATAATWAVGSYTGDYAADNNADIRYAAVCSDDPLNGGVTGLLMDLRVTTYYDANGDDALTSDEPRCDFRTQLGRFSTYEALNP
ncbi:hypothetical protein [Botrimarina hoheduenensis]|nr:hypothetical protein [Botrimarina hoheduenensis]